MCRWMKKAVARTQQLCFYILKGNKQNLLCNIFSYNKNIQIIKVKRDTRTFLLMKLCKTNYKKLRTYVVHSTGTGHRGNTVLVSSENTSAPTMIETLEYINEKWFQ